jgi:hypothetical protein
MTVLVIGNGESRKHIDINQVTQIKVGCNAIIRDYHVDHLVCIDRRTLLEATENTQFQGKIYTRSDWMRMTKDTRIQLVPQLPYTGTTRPDDPTHWGSGPYALLIAANLSTDINLIGFDLWSRAPTVNNVYKDTKNYDAATKRAVDPRYWIYQISRLFQCYPNKYFTVYNDKEWNMPESWQLANVAFKSLDKFIET